MKHFIFTQNITVKKTVLILLTFFFVFNLKSQNFNVEPGIVVGTSYYIGDINHSKHFYSPKLAFGLALRHNFNTFYALRLNIIRATISGNDADFSNIYQKARAHSFINNLYEFGLQSEFNFLNYNSYKKKSYSPYLTVGIAFVALNNFSSYTAALPIGVGWKYSPIKKLTVSAEWVFRSTTSDKLDLLLAHNENTKQITKTKSNDWYSIAGITVSYNFRSDKKWCPAYKKK